MKPLLHPCQKIFHTILSVAFFCWMTLVLPAHAAAPSPLEPSAACTNCKDTMCGQLPPSSCTELCLAKGQCP